MRSAAYSTVLTAAGAIEEWALVPRSSVRKLFFPLWAITTSMLVGSPTKQPSGRGCQCRMSAMISLAP